MDSNFEEEYYENLAREYEQNKDNISCEEDAIEKGLEEIGAY